MKGELLDLILGHRNMSLAEVLRWADELYEWVNSETAASSSGLIFFGGGNRMQAIKLLLGQRDYTSPRQIIDEASLVAAWLNPDPTETV